MTDNGQKCSSSFPSLEAKLYAQLSWHHVMALPRTSRMLIGYLRDECMMKLLYGTSSAVAAYACS